jgi:hypothetical protein
MTKKFQYFKTEITAGLSMFLAVWTMTFLYAQVMGDFKFSSQHWFICICILNISGALLSSFFIKQPFIIAPGLSVGWFFCHLLNPNTSPQTLFIALIISGPLLLLLSQFKLLKETKEFLPQSLQENINIGIGFLFISIALNQQFQNYEPSSIINFSTFLFFLTIISLFLFKIYKKKSGFIITVFLNILIANWYHPSPLHQLFALPPKINTILEFNQQPIASLQLLKHILEITLFSLFDTAIGVFCLQQLQMILHVPRQPILSKAYKAVGLNNMLSGFLLCGPNTTFIESSVGIQLGASKSTSILTVGFCFLIFLFCLPLGDYIPKELVRGILFFIGCSLITPLYQMRYKTLTANFLSLSLIALMIIQKSILDGLIAAILSKLFFDRINQQKSLPILYWGGIFGLIILSLRLI